MKRRGEHGSWGTFECVRMLREVVGVDRLLTTWCKQVTVF